MKSYTPDVAAALTAVVDRLRDFQDDVELYLDQIREHQLQHWFPQRLGISHIVLNSLLSRLENQDYWSVLNNKIGNGRGRWSSLKNDAVIGGLRSLFRDCSIVQFADWSKTVDASEFWYGLFSDVIRPLNKRDYEFIFHPGNVSARLSFEVNELLDIIGDYASYGRVTLMVDEEDADRLWSRLNGRATYATSSGFRSPNVKEKYLFLFNAMRVDVLLINGNDRMVLLSRDGQFNFTGKSLNKISVPDDNRGYFNSGYQLGLLLQLDIPYCIVLGRAISGAAAKYATRLGAAELFSFINNCILESRQVSLS
jgi:hypothetical protein